MNDPKESAVPPDAGAAERRDGDSDRRHNPIDRRRLRHDLIGQLVDTAIHPSIRWIVGLALAAGLFISAAIGAGFNVFFEYTGTLEFCISCHEMKDTVYEEYRKSVHFINHDGVRVSCSDCHVPREWFAKLGRKIRATNELFHWARGTIDSPEKFEAKRLELAEHVWAEMKGNDSRECRNCHSYEAMDFHKQRARSSEKMQDAMKKGETCIECHKGIAHKLPVMPRDD